MVPLFKRATIGLPLLLAIIGAFFYVALTPQSAAAAPNSSQSDCEELGGRWNGTVGPLAPGTSRCTGATPRSAAMEAEHQTERWLRMRGIYGCINERGLASWSEADLTSGRMFNGGATAIGYLNEDGKVSCNDEAFVSNSNDVIGFSSTLHSYCAAQPSSVRLNGSNCISGSGRLNNAEDDGPTARQWLNGLKGLVSDWSAFMTTNGGQREESKYVMYYNSLVEFCGATRDKPYGGTAAERREVEGDKRKVVINEVDGEGKIVPYVYTLDRDQGDRIDDVYQELGSDSNDLTCSFMAERTWQLDDAMRNYTVQYARAYPNAPTDSLAEANGIEGEGEDTTNCKVEGVGWIVCPVLEFIAELNDGALGFLGDNFLEIEPSLYNNRDALAAWNGFKDLANVLFVIAFMIIVYSQLTGAGITNYGIKRMLPKLVAVAILVNASFILCSLALDGSNIVGSSVASFFGQSMPAGSESGNDYTTFNDLSWVEQTGVILAGGAALAIGIVLLLSVGLAGLAALAMIVLILVARKAIVIMLVVVAPVAFAAYLLPNTEGIFKKWWGMFKAMLFLYPLIGIVFGASLLASKIISNSSSEAMVQLIALGVMAVPLFAIPFLLKGAMSATGAVGTKLTSLMDRANSGASRNMSDRAKQMTTGAADAYKTRALAGGYVPGGGFIRRRSRRDDFYKNLGKKREGAEEEFLSSDDRSAGRRRQVLLTQERGSLATTANENLAKSQGLVDNHQLHDAAHQSGLKLHDEEAVHKANSTNAYLAAGGAGAALRTQAIQAGATSSNTEETLKNNALGSHMRDTANFGQYDALSQSKGEMKNAQLEQEKRYEGSMAGRAQSGARKGLEDQLDVVKSEQDEDYKTSVAGKANTQAKKVAGKRVEIADAKNDLTYKRSSEGIGQGQELKIVQKDSKIADTQTDVAYEASLDGKNQAMELSMEEGRLEIAKGEQGVAFASSGVSRAQTVVKDSIAKQKTIATSAADVAALAQNTDVNIQAQAAQDSIEAAKATESAFIQELRTEEGALQNPSYAAESQVLQNADIRKRVETQRSAIAQKIAGQEFATKIGEPGTTTTYATEAAGIGGAAAMTQVQAVAKKTMLGALREGIDAEKVTLSETPHDRYTDKAGNSQPGLMEIVKDNTQSLERRAAAAGMIMQNGYRDGHVDLIEYLADDANSADPAISDIQQQAHSDMKSAPMIMGSTQLSEIGNGRLKVKPRQDPSDPSKTVSVREELMLRRLEEGKISEQSLAGLDPDEVKIIKRLHDRGALSAKARSNFEPVMDRLRSNPQAYQPTKQAQRKTYDEIYPPASKSTP